MDGHIRTLRKEELIHENRGYFDDENAERVTSWLVSAEGRAPVVLVGAGFSRNAIDLATAKQVNPSQVPLWADLVRLLSGDLGVGPDRYDAPTLFEMYEEVFGEAKLRDVLRNSIRDGALAPGDPHNALSQYPCESIVTTNCLDTLLDRSCREARRVVVDSDLSASGSRKDLIYLHGHRDVTDSWVMTRSQYEDFPRKKPVIVARVRQLLAQHPWLLVGFGLSDPNFHSIVRLVGLEMKGHQPLSLALMLEAPSTAERRHWRRLGIEIATPAGGGKDKLDFGAFLAWAFPKLDTTYSPTSAAAQDYVRRGPTQASKLTRFREIYSTPIVDPGRAYDSWRSQLRELLSAEEQAAAEDAATSAFEAGWSAGALLTRVGADSNLSGTPPPARTSLSQGSIFAGLESLSPLRPLASFDEVQWLEILLRVGGSLLGELTNHLAWGLSNRLFEGVADGPPWEVLAFRMAQRSGQSLVAGLSLRDLLHLAIVSAGKYGRQAVVDFLRKEGHELNLQAAMDLDPPHQRHVLEARMGFEAFMNGDFVKAAGSYRAAAGAAFDSGLVFEQWAYTVGQLDALVRRGPAEPTDDEYLAARQRLLIETKRLAGMPAVRQWRDRAEKQARSVLEEVVIRMREHNRFRRTGGRGLRFGGAGNLLWKSFRDLETIHAPPSLRSHYLGPLLPLLTLSELMGFLSLVPKPSEWLEESISQPVASFAERQARDRQIVDFLLAPSGSLSLVERGVRLECLRAVGHVYRTGDIETSLAWLRSLKISAGRVPFVDSTRAISSDYWLAFSAAAHWADIDLAREAAVASIAEVGLHDPEAAVAAMLELPWASWRPLSASSGTIFIKALSDLVTRTSNATHQRALIANHALVALLRMLDAGLEKAAVSPHLDAWLELLQTVKVSNAEARRAAFLVDRELSALSGSSRSTFELLSEWFGEAVVTELDRHRDEQLWGVLAELVDASPELLPRLGVELERLLQDGKAIRYYGLNPEAAWGPIAIVAKSIELVPEHRSKAGAFLLELLRGAPHLLGVAAKAINAEYWDEGPWRELMSFLSEAATGSAPSRDLDPGLRTRQQLGVLALLGEFRDASLAESEPSIWLTLQSLALGAVNDERLVVANRAAYAVVGVARRISVESSAQQQYATAIKRIAEDPRVAVRGAIAHAGPDLCSSAQSQLIREAARHAVSIVECDDNALVHHVLSRARAVSAKTQ